MSKLVLSPKNNKHDVKFEVYDLSFKTFHEEKGVVNGSGSLNIEDGYYKVKAIDGDRVYRKVVKVDGDSEYTIDFAERYTPINTESSGLKAALAVMLVIALLGGVLYYVGAVEALAELLAGL